MIDSNGVIRVPPASGLGVDVDEERLARTALVTS